MSNVHTQVTYQKDETTQLMTAAHLQLRGSEKEKREAMKRKDMRGVKSEIRISYYSKRLTIFKSKTWTFWVQEFHGPLGNPKPTTVARNEIY